MANLKQINETKWQITISAGFDEKGNRNRIYRTITAKNEKDAIKQANVLEDKVEQGDYNAPIKYTLSQYVDVWKKDAERRLAPKTFHRYMECLNLRVLPSLGNVKLDRITPIMLEDFYNDLREPQKRVFKYKDGRVKETEYLLSEESVKCHHRIISAILQKVYRQGLIKENPCSRVDAPQPKKKSMQIYELDQISALIEVLESANLKLKTSVYLALTGGLRLGEIMGLEYSDISYINNTIHVQRASQYIPKKGIITKDPKNDSSTRIISLPPETMQLIRELEYENKLQKIACANLWKNSNRLFVNPEGAPMFPDLPSKWFRKFLKANELPKLVFHGLRHTSASYLISQGEDVVTVSKRLGHANTSTTLNIYSHSFKKRDEAAAAKMSVLFENKNKIKEVK